MNTLHFSIPTDKEFNDLAATFGGSPAPQTANVSVSRIAVNKNGYERDKYEFGNSFHPEEHSIESLYHVLAVEGYPITMQHRREPPGDEAQKRGVSTFRHTENFISVQVIGLDDDRAEPGVVDSWRADPFFQRYGAFIYETASSTPEAERCRVMFVLDEPLTTTAAVTEMMRAFQERYPDVDRLVDATRVWYGAKGTTGHLVGKMLPMAIAETEVLAPYRAVLEAERKQKEAKAEKRRLKNAATRQQIIAAGLDLDIDNAIRQSIESRLNGVFNTVANAQSGRHSLIHWAGRTVGSLQAAAWSAPHRDLFIDIETRIETAADANGYTAKYGDSVRTFRDGLNVGFTQPDLEATFADLTPKVARSASPPSIPDPVAGLAATLAEGLAEQAELRQIIVNPKCGGWRWGTHPHGGIRKHIMYCGYCTECIERLAERAENTVLRRLTNRFDDNDSLVVSMVLNVPESGTQALLKRIQRDKTAHYYRTVNADGAYDFIIQAEKAYGDIIEIEALQYDFVTAVESSKKFGERQSGLLFGLHSKRVNEDEGAEGEKYSLSTTKFQATNPADNGRINAIAKTIKATEVAYTADEYQQRMFDASSLFASALKEAGIGFGVEGIVGTASDRDRLKYNANVAANLESVQLVSLQETSTRNYLDISGTQISLSDKPAYTDEPDPGLWLFETTEKEAIARQIELCGYPSEL